MNSIYGAYLEDFNLIKVIIPKNNYFDKISLIGNNSCIDLRILKEEYFALERHLFLEFNEEILLYKDYFVDIGEYHFHLNLGKITRTKKFEDKFYYDGSLGCKYHPLYSEFRLWTPVSKEVILCLNDEKLNMEYSDYGVWYLKVNKNLDKAKYYYLVRINETFEKVLDPYGISSNANNEVNYVIDFNKTYKLKYDYVINNNPIMYEANIRDLNGNCDNNDSLYLKTINHLDYIKNLGISHIQLMPTFCFGGVNELIKDNKNSDFSYNWGYNPIQYFIPSGWFSSNPSDPYARINEFKMLIDEMHKENLGVVLDVVFNHIYDIHSFSYGILVPGYVYRTDGQGFLMNSSYCGCDLRTEAKMVRKFILDNIMFYQEMYKIDGFRFDLMGLLDNKTMLDILNSTKKINDNTILYGEGWYMSTTLKMEDNANLSSAKVLYPIKFFNDYFRNMIGGSNNGRKGFILGDDLSLNEFNNLINNGSCINYPFKDYLQSINYLECHDNLTLKDKVNYLTNDFEKVKNSCKLGLGLVIISKGVPFIHSGQELMRSKKGIDNSYNLNDDINHFPWENVNSTYDLSLFLKNIIDLKKQGFFDNVDSLFKKKDYYEIRYNHNKYQVIIKNNYVDTLIYFCPNTVLIFDNGDIRISNCESLNINVPGIWVLKKK